MNHSENIQQLFQQAYNRKEWLRQLRRFFLEIDIFERPRVVEDKQVENFLHLGNAKIDDQTSLGIYEVKVGVGTQLPRNRVQLRQMVASQILPQTLSGALAVYVDDNNAQWRFSYIAITHRLSETGELERIQTPPKRFTYLFGEGAKVRTAVKRFDELPQNSSLQDLQSAFAVESLNKEFYDKLYKWYERAQGRVVFPNDEQKLDKEAHIATSLIRLLTRLLFIWFLKEKNLINLDLFDKEKLQNFIYWHKNTSFYKAILQNLFFATLNREISDRSFRITTKGKTNDNNNYLVTNIYRYRDYFKGKNEAGIIKLFAQTPFLNGGLFECLDREATEEEKEEYNQNEDIRLIRSAIRMDGFSDRKDNVINIPNDLFFNVDETGLIDLLGQYQFTVEESTSLDVEVALDPELLGKVLENLLATYTPETKKVARKATGSYYTPREIVDYMVDESLKAYLQQAVPPEDGDSAFYAERLADLFNTSRTGEPTKKTVNTSLLNTSKNPEPPKKQPVLSAFYDEEIPLLIKAIDNVRILDPAVGSGAFPMGILQRLVALLECLDPKNKQFKQCQLDKADEIKDRESRESAKAAIEAVFADENAHNHYGRKLYLIENCLYGVDIQPISIQIAKLRFFISLAIEQQPNDNQNDNYGIKALPNLETKFIAANSLIGLKIFTKGQQNIQDKDTKEKIKENKQKLSRVRQRYFNAKTLETKRKCQEDDKELREETSDLLKKDGWGDDNAEKISHWDPYSLNTAACWYDSEWMFDITGGFDVVIGNPPYAQVKKGTYSKIQFPYSEGKDKGKQNRYKLFTEHSYNLCKDKGVACMIVQSSLMSDLSASFTRKCLLKKANLQFIIEFPKAASSKEKQVFSSVTQGTCIYQFIKGSVDDYKINISINNDNQSIKSLRFATIQKSDLQNLYPISNYFAKVMIGGFPIVQRLKNNISLKTLSSFVQYIRQGDINLTEHSAQFSKENTTGKKLMRGKHVARYKIRYDLVDEYINNKFKTEKIQFNKENCFLISQEVTGTNDARRLHFALQDNKNEQVLWAHTANKTLLIDQEQTKFFLALLNSKFMDWYFRITSSNNHVQIYELEQLPIPEISQAKQQPLVSLVDKIIEAKANNSTADTSDLEAKIDKKVYRLYDLTNEEIQIIGGNT